MVQSVELLLDESGEAAVRRQWRALADAGFASSRPDHRPHITLAVAREIWPRLENKLEAVNFAPFPLRIGAPLVFGDRRMILVRSVAPSIPLLELQRAVAEIVAGCPGTAANMKPGQWTPHVTLARRVATDGIGAGIGIAATFSDVDTVAIGVRRWDGTNRREWRIA